MKGDFIFATVVTIVFALGLLYSFSDVPLNDPWVVPEKYKTLKNPVKADKESLSLGKSLYMKHCKSCHGKEGLGDGPKAAQLDTPSGDFTEEEFQVQSDGAIFYKIKEGRDDMPSFKKKIPDEEDIWNLVNFLRTLEE